MSTVQDDARPAVFRQAAKLFLERGVAGTRGDDIAEACGLSKRTVRRQDRTPPLRHGRHALRHRGAARHRRDGHAALRHVHRRPAVDGRVWQPGRGTALPQPAALLALYHAVGADAGCPAILATTADADDRVVPAHSFKYVAALQAAKPGPKPRLLRIETRAGHGAGMPLDKAVARHADMRAFAHWTGLTLGQAE